MILTADKDKDNYHRFTKCSDKMFLLQPARTWRPDKAIMISE